jgi:Ser/Thr protein kinase RdoA (MazF antagonist)
MTTPFEGLDPDTVLACLESVGMIADGRLMALNSYENRVYRVGIEQLPVDEQQPLSAPDMVVVKFYRPQRWTDAQIREEHAFARELVAAQLPVAAPQFIGGQALHRHLNFRFAMFACLRATAPDLDQPGARAVLGRTLGRIHARSALRRFEHRGSLDDMRCGDRARAAILNLGIMPEPQRSRYDQVARELIAAVRERWEAVSPPVIRLHGDCHLGNILWSPQGPVFVDLDDCLMGPRMQDLWMFCSGSPAQQQAEWTELIEGYLQFADFDFREVALIESLRAMRMMHHAAWLAQRWDDPAFPLAFPWFGEARFWDRHIADLQEQLEAVRDPPLLRA